MKINKDQRNLVNITRDLKKNDYNKEQRREYILNRLNMEWKPARDTVLGFITGTFLSTLYFTEISKPDLEIAATDILGFIPFIAGLYYDLHSLLITETNLKLMDIELKQQVRLSRNLEDGLK